MIKLPVCQRCRLPLVPHESLKDLSQPQINLLTSNLNRPEDKSVEKSTNGNSRDVLFSAKERAKWAADGGGGPGESFYVVTQSLMAGSGNESFATYEGVDQNPYDGGGFIDDARNYDEATAGNVLNGRNGENEATDNSGEKDAEEYKAQQVYILENLFEELSGKSDIDYPICTDCAEILQDNLKVRYEESCRERDIYISFLNTIKKDPEPGSEKTEKILKDISELEKKNQEALQELKTVEQKRRQLEQELEDLEKESDQLTIEEESFYEKQNELYLELSDYQNEKDRMHSLYKYHSMRLQKLQQSNVYNDTFNIGFDGLFGTINGLRLGRIVVEYRADGKVIKEHIVDWSEINAAWGQTLLLIATVIQKLNFKLVGYRLRPLGSMSKIERQDSAGKWVSLELYSSGEYAIGRYVGNYKVFDSAMVAFLNVLNQVGRFLMSLDPSFEFDFKIENDRIEGDSIKLLSDPKNEKWTECCKRVLKNSKKILAKAADIAGTQHKARQKTSL